MGAKLEDQYLIIGGMLNNEFATSSSISELTNDYFEDPSCSIIFQSFKNYYNDYHKIPSELEMDSLIKDNYIPVGPSLESVINTCQKLISLGGKIDEEYLLDQIEKFIRDVRVSRQIERVLEKYNSTGNVDSHKFAKDLSTSLDFSLAKSGITSMSNTEEVLKSRSEVIGGDDGSKKIVKSIFPLVNTSFSYRGYVQGSLNLVVAPPGCFTGDTKIMTLDHKVMTMEDAYKSQKGLGIYGIDPGSKNLLPAPADKVVLASYTDDLIELTIDRNKVIRCTPDHPFMLEDGSYVKAENLTHDMLLMPIHRGSARLGQLGTSEIISSTDEVSHFTYDLMSRWIKGYEEGSVLKYKDKNPYNNNVSNLEWTKTSSKSMYSHLDHLHDKVNHHRVTGLSRLKTKNKVPVYGVMHAGYYGNYSIALDNEGHDGIFVSNTGKTNLLVNEGAYAAQQGFEVLHIFLGDMLEYDGFLRYAANITGQDQNELIKLTEQEVINLVNVYSSSDESSVFSRISYKAFASAEITVDSLISYIINEEKSKNKNYDVIIIDYADNFALLTNNSYNELGDVYDKLLYLARMNHSVVLTASQPKIGYWDQEIIPLEGAGDSSKKQRVIDMMMTFNKPYRSSSVGTIYLPKIRRGTTGNFARVRLDNRLCRITQISEDEYNQIKDTESADSSSQ